MPKPPPRRDPARGVRGYNSTLRRYATLRQQGRRARAWAAVRKRFLYQRLVRDGVLACEACGRQTGSVDVHHVVRRSLAPHLVYEATNLRVLCRSCHRREHERENAPD